MAFCGSDCPGIARTDSLTLKDNYYKIYIKSERVYEKNVKEALCAVRADSHRPCSCARQHMTSSFQKFEPADAVAQKYLQRLVYLDIEPPVLRPDLDMLPLDIIAHLEDGSQIDFPNKRNARADD